jgi:dTDP-4-dehydrorhamnose reductase|tara:strand:- start:3658 stop:4551 length:894 start_codon:yes stop_codon:yes gene_type:complete
MSKNIPQLKKNTFKYLLIGSNGLLGGELKKILPRNQTISLARNNASIILDLKNFSKLKKIFQKYKFKYVINCAGITDLNFCQKNYKKCKIINSLLPKKLTKLSIKHDFKLIQISTDQFFKNNKFKLNSEKDKIYPINNYAKSKILCEKHVKENKKNLIIRTNFTGFKKRNKRSTFVGWLCDSILKKKTINLYNDIYVSTLDVNACAKLILKLIKLKAKGVFNCATNKPLTKKDFGIYFSKKISKKISYKEVSVNSASVKRQKYLGLKVDKIEKKLGMKMISPYKAIDNLASIHLNKK